MTAIVEEHGSEVLAPELDEILSSSWRELENIQASLITAPELQDVRSIIVFSGGVGEGCTTAAILMALGLAKDSRVLLMDLDVNRPQIHELLGMTRRPGLADAFEENRVLQSSIRNSEWPNLSILTFGKEIDQPSRLIRSQRFDVMLKQLSKDFQYVIADSGSLLVGSDVPILASKFDAGVLVVNGGDTRWQVAQIVRDRFEAAKGKLAGVVLNRRKYYIPKWAYRFL